MAEHAENRSGIEERLRRIGSEPTRLRALAILNERAAGASELAEELGLSVAETGRRLEQMQRDDLIEPVGEVLGASAIEPSYRATLKVLWSDEEWAELDLSERRAIAAEIVQAINADVCRSLESGTFEERTDAHVSRQVCRVDEQGWRELNRIHAQALEDSLAVEARSAKRLAASGERGFTVISAVICGELPQQERL